MSGSITGPVVKANIMNTDNLNETPGLISSEWLSIVINHRHSNAIKSILDNKGITWLLIRFSPVWRIPLLYSVFQNKLDTFFNLKVTCFNTSTTCSNCFNIFLKSWCVGSNWWKGQRNYHSNKERASDFIFKNGFTHMKTLWQYTTLLFCVYRL